MKQDTLKSFFSKYGNIINVRMQTRGLWQHAYITYEKPQDIALFYEQWSRYLYNDCVRIYPASFTPEQVKLRNDFRIKLTNLPFGTSSRDLHDITLATKAKSCYIPRSNNYKPRPFAIFYFQSEEELNDAIKTPYALDNHELQWCSAEAKCCHKCGSTEHLVMKCSMIDQPNKDDNSNNRRPRNQLPSVQKLYNRFKPAGSRSLINKNTNNHQNERSYSNVTKGNNKDPNPKSSSVNDSSHNPNKKDDTNAKLDKILSMLTGMQKAMSDLKTRIAKLE